MQTLDAASALLNSNSGQTRRRAIRLPSPGQAIDALIMTVLAAGVFVVHSLHYILTTPFWLDEAWVADSTRMPLKDLPHVTSVTPLGWTVLLRFVNLGGQQRFRLLPLGFAVLAVAVAYLVGRSLPWGSPGWSRAAGAMTALAVLLAPASLRRNDLKPYTADAFVALSVLLLVLRFETSRSRGRLAALSAVCVIGFLISSAAPFVAFAAFSALVATAVASRDTRRMLQTAAAGAITAIALGGVFLILYRPHIQPNLTQYWLLYYPPVDKGIGPVWGFLHRSGNEMAAYLGMGPLLLALLLIAAGVLTMVRAKRPSLGYLAPILILEMFIAGAAKRYPFFDQRTSYFLTVILAVFAAVGVMGICSLIARRSSAASIAVLALVAGLFCYNIRNDVRKHSIPAEDARTPTAFVAQNRLPSDIVLVSESAGHGFAYYWPIGRPSWRPSPAANGFQAFFPDQHDIVFTIGRGEPDIQTALDSATTAAANTPRARIWVIRTHVTKDENRIWLALLRQRRFRVDPIVPCSLLILTPLPDGAEPSTGRPRGESCF